MNPQIQQLGGSALLLGHRTTLGVDRTIPTKRNDPALGFFYNIESTVGRNQPNERRSVLLVQHMLDVFLSRHGAVVGIDGIVANGEFGSETDAAIRAFQRWLQVSPHAGVVPETGIISPVRYGTVNGPRGSYVPALLLLNRIWASVDPDSFIDPRRAAPILGNDLAAELYASIHS